MMKFDTIIIGGGLTGLACAIKLQQSNQKTIIITTGHSALHFSSGSFDLYSHPEDENLSLMENVSLLIGAKKEHPYAKIGIGNIEQLMLDSKNILANAGIETYGSEKQNHYRLTPMGKLVPTWLTQSGYAISEANRNLPWGNTVVFGVEGYLDFVPHFVADELKELGVEARTEMIDMPIINTLRLSPTGLIATSIARELEKEDHRAELIKIIKEKTANCSTILLPACVGMNCDEDVKYFEKELAKTVLLIPTLPPSVAGASMQKRLTDYYKKLGGVYMLGDTVEKADLANNRIERVYSYNHTNIPFTADTYVLASGGFFSRGLISTNKDVREPLLGLDVDFKSNRFSWYSKGVFDAHEYQSFGVKSTSDFKAQIKGSTIDNLYVAGALLNGCNSVKEGTGGGVALLSALYVAEQILKR